MSQKNKVSFYLNEKKAQTEAQAARKEAQEAQREAEAAQREAQEAQREAEAAQTEAQAARKKAQEARREAREAGQKAENYLSALIKTMERQNLSEEQMIKNLQELCGITENEAMDAAGRFRGQK